MTDLLNQKCIPCHGGEPAATAAEIAAFKPQIPDWLEIVVDGEQRLERAYKFPDFQTAIAFTNAVGDLAEAEGHHPALLTEWGKVTVTWWTHAIGGLHLNDLIMAAKTDEIAAKFDRP
jgi:4a-hydroxytetrahydrobiopterin dehydratase